MDHPLDYTCSENVWIADAFWKHVQSVIEFDREVYKQLGADKLNEDQIRKTILMVWIDSAIPAGNG